MEAARGEAHGGGSDSPLVQLPKLFVDERGSILNLLLSGCGGVSLIDTRAGSCRSDHYHKEDWHYLFVVRGQMEYRWRKVGEKKTHHITVHSGEMVYTGPMVEHSTYFPKDTLMVSMSKFGRDHATHEADLVRVERLA